MSSNIEKNYSDQRNKTKKYSDGKKGKDTLTGRDKFRVEVVNILLDSLISKLNKRGEVYEKLGKKFKFLIDIGNTLFQILMMKVLTSLQHIIILT